MINVADGCRGRFRLPHTARGRNADMPGKQWKPPKREQPWTLRDFAAFARHRGGELLTDAPADLVPKASDRLHFRCARGHEWAPRATATKNQGYWCFKCARAGDNVWSLVKYREHATAHGGELIDSRPDDDVPSATERLKFRCAAGHTWNTVAYSIKRDRPWCRTCSRTTDPWDASHYRRYAEERGGRLLSRHPKGVIEHKTAVRFRCAEGHEWSTTAGQIKSYSTWCWPCGHESRKKQNDDLEALAASRGGRLVKPGKNRNYVFEWQCARGHLFLATPGNVKQGYWCSQCSASRSERIVRAYFEQMFGHPFPRVRPDWLRNTTGYRLELDGYCEPLSLAFEHQGGHHYREVKSFASHTLAAIRARDARKRRVCKARGVTLIEIPELISGVPIEDLQGFIVDACRRLGVSLPRGAGSRTISLTPVYTSSADDEALEEIRSLAARRGGQCLATEYKGSDTQLPFECADGHGWNARPQDVLRGTWCRRCAAKITGAKRRLSIDMMHDVAKRRGGECLSEIYVDSWVKLRWRCGQCCHEWEATPTSVRRGTWCPRCAVQERWERRRRRYGEGGGNAKRKPKYTIADMRDMAATRSGECLSAAYIDAHTRLEWRCGECGREWLAAPSDVRKGTWCPQCARRRRGASHAGMAAQPKRPRTPRHSRSQNPS